MKNLQKYKDFVIQSTGLQSADRINIVYSVFIILASLLCLSFCEELSIALAGEYSPKEKKVSRNTGNIWYENWDEGMDAAKKENKPVLVDFIRDNCRPCVKMDSETFSAPEVSKRLVENWVCIRINTSLWKYKKGTFNGKTMNYYKLAKHFNLKLFPTFLFIDKNNEPFYLRHGFYDKREFCTMLDKLIDEDIQKNLKLSYSNKKNSSIIHISIMISIVFILLTVIFIFVKQKGLVP